jgi:ATP-binding cassette subfamily B (MDR/TAP) protein 1
MQKKSFGELGAYMAKHVRTELYTNMLTKHIGWHDLRENTAGLMTVVLATDVEKLEGAATEVAALYIQVILLAVVAFTMGFVYSWKLTLGAIIFVPFIYLGINLNVKNSPNSIMPVAKAKDAENSADILASDSIQNYKTIASFASEDIMISEYEKHLDTAKEGFIRQSKRGGFAFGFS